MLALSLKSSFLISLPFVPHGLMGEVPFATLVRGCSVVVRSLEDRAYEQIEPPDPFDMR